MHFLKIQSQEIVRSVEIVAQTAISNHHEESDFDYPHCNLIEFNGSSQPPSIVHVSFSNLIKYFNYYSDYSRDCAAANLEPPPKHCLAGEFRTRCGVKRCLLLPGDLCEDIAKAEISGKRCHSGITGGCGCDGRCSGELIINGVNYSHTPKACMSIGKRSHPKFPFANGFDDNNSLDYPVENFSDV